LDRNIIQAFGKTLPEARDGAIPTARSWGDQCWATYKATVRRNGLWKRDFNAELWQPMEVKLASGWERAFQRRLPNVLQSFVVELGKILDSFHNSAVAYAKEHCVNLAGITVLEQQLQGRKLRFGDIPTRISNIAQEMQKDANRSFTPVIAQDMRPVYTICNNEAGPGSYMRMKNHMAGYVDNARDTMFKHATDHVADQLKVMCDCIRHELDMLVLQGAYQQTSGDYHAVLVGSNKHNFSTLSRAERILRVEMLLALEEADTAFDDCIPVPHTDPAVKTESD
jgi:hypothetical protein